MGFICFLLFPQSLGVLLTVMYFGQGGAGVLGQSLLALLSHCVPLFSNHFPSLSFPVLDIQVDFVEEKAGLCRTPLCPGLGFAEHYLVQGFQQSSEVSALCLDEGMQCSGRWLDRCKPTTWLHRSQKKLPGAIDPWACQRELLCYPFILFGVRCRTLWVLGISLLVWVSVDSGLHKLLLKLLKSCYSCSTSLCGKAGWNPSTSTPVCWVELLTSFVLVACWCPQLNL